MITGIGIDVVHIPRILRLWQRFGDKFLYRVFSQQEIFDSSRYQDVKSKSHHFAKRFAAKEAFVKALGTGFLHVQMNEISVQNDDRGKPEIILSGSTAKNLSTLQKKIHLSLSDDHETAIAFVIVTI